MSEQSDETNKDTLNEYDRHVLEQLVVDTWGLSVATLKRMMYCGIDEISLVLIEDPEINELFSDPRMLGQKILFKHRLRQWRLEQQSILQNAHADQLNGSAIRSIGSNGGVLGRHHHAPANGNPAKRKYPFEVDPIPTLPPSDDEAVSVKMELGTSSPLPAIVPPPFGTLPVLPPLLRRKNSEQQSLQERTSGAIGDIPVRIDKLSLLRLLQSSQSGRWILSSFKPSQPLERRGQTIITHLIVDQFLHFNILFKHRLMCHYASVITELFPAEIKELYYAPRNTVKRNTSGKLFDRYTNQRLRHKNRLPRAKPFVVDEWTEQKTFAELAIMNEAMNGRGDFMGRRLSANGDATGSDDGNVSSDFLQPLTSMYVEGEDQDPMSSGSAVDYSTRETDMPNRE
ncbi:uncharacterized protein LOC131282205 [Anopheles ziemanni]|uniref:uncharacterized protein LOC131266217 n=1 Tax=Anopheles coustani TaxID=139045 RepID=UPI002657FBC2|nr:uncharacterized protein LOC131266217 [Anopheles coustani]XP_058167598.1 uncharacterized protein LOC131282205 [Anopheles ziemanni]